MTISRRGVVLVTSTVALVLVGLLALGAFAYGQAGGDGPPWRDGAPWHHGGEGGWGGRHGWLADPERIREARAELARDLAAELETSAERVEAALRAVVADRLQETVEAGEVGQAEAAEALADYDQGDLRALLHVVKREWRTTTEDT